MIAVYADREALGRGAAGLFAQAAVRAVEERGRFAVLLAGGETPRRTYELLAEEPFRSRVPWERLHVFWGDERCVPADDPRNNALMARRALLDRVPIPASQLHPLDCAASPEKGAADYEALLGAFFAGALPSFDLVFLGLGDDGHTASLFPGSTALDERQRWTIATRRPGEEIGRVTATLPLLNRAALVAFLVSGKSKAAVLRQVLAEEGDPRRLPALLVRPAAGELHWLVDRDAASLLDSGRQVRPLAAP